MSIQSVKRAITILTLFTPETPRLGITDISRQMNLPKPTIHGLVQTLIEQDFLIQDKETRKYSLGLRIHELGTILSGTLKINQVGGSVAQRLARDTGLMVRLATWDRDFVLITLNLFPTVDDSFLFRQLGLGPRVPAYCTGVGKAILSTYTSQTLDTFLQRTRLTGYTARTITDPAALAAQLEEARTRGYTRESEEYLHGLACIAAPVFDATGRATCAVSLSGAPGLLDRPDLSELADRLRQAAAEISLNMGCPASLLMAMRQS
jgi:DNA-binding IclR family transcriptional regulator